MTPIGSHWAVLGIEPTTDIGIIRRAYAAKLKLARPEDDRIGFEQLRAAYELAMRLTKRGVAPEAAPPVAAVISAPTSQPSAVHATKVDAISSEDLARDELQRAFGELRDLLNADDAASARADTVLASILDSPSLQNLAIEQSVERQLSLLLAASIPRSDPLLLRVSNRFRWLQSGVQLQLTSAVAAVLARLYDLEFLNSIRSGDSPYADGFRKLQKRKIPLLSWMAAHFNKSGVASEYQVLNFVRLHHPALVPLLNPATAAWWDRQASRPHVSFPIIVIGLIFTSLGVVGTAATDGLGSALSGAVRVAGVFGALVLWKLFLLDWPRILLRRRWPLLPLALRFGWLPASVVIVLVSAIVPDSRVAAFVLAVPALCVAQWSWIVGGMDAQSEGGRRSDLLSIPFIRFLVHNLIVGLWWLGALERMPPALALSVTVGCALVASSVGSPAARAAWEQQFSSAQRKRWIGVTALLAAAACACLWLLTPNERWRGLAAALVVAAVVAHRHAAIMLGRRQQEIRFGWMIACVVALIAVLAGPVVDLQSRGAFPTGLGLILASTVLLCTAMMLWNERRGHIAPYRDDPIHESLQW